MQVPVHYNPRTYQADFMRNMSKVRFAVLCWARRAGKDMTCFAYAVRRMVEEPMNVVLVFPSKSQGYEAFWANVENDGFKTIEHIPKDLVMSSRNTKDEMSITLKNGSTFMLLGADDPEKLRGANGKLYIFSEFVDINSEALNVVRPITAVNGGQIIIQSTPKIDGISGGTFKRLFDSAKENIKQLASYVQATEYLSAEQLEEIRQDYIAQNGDDFKFRQEMLLDWGQASTASYYGQVLTAMEKDGRIGDHPYDARYQVYTAWDLGMADSTAVTFFQYYDKTIHIIDAYETHDISDEAVIRFIQSKPYNYGWHFFPHDASKRDSDAIQRIQKIRELGLINSSILRRTSVEDGIRRALVLFRNDLTMHYETTYWAIEKLKVYQRKFNPKTGDYEGADHSTASHLADSIRYMAEALDQMFDPTTGKPYMLVSQSKTTVADEEDWNAAINFAF